MLSALWGAVGPVARYRPSPYDVYLHYQYGDDLHDRFPARVRLAIPCGADVRDLEGSFDAILLEAPDNDVWVGDPSKAVLMPPPLDVPSRSMEPVESIPSDFFLTIFNTHNRGKGFTDLLAVAPDSPLPIVWCRSSQYALPREVSNATRVVVKTDATQAQLRFLYERCRAYISFDHNRGFGWSLADALQYGAPVLSRGHGVMTLDHIDRTQTYRYETVDDLLALLHGDQFRHVERRLDSLAPDQFVRRFEALADSLGSRTR